MDLHMACHALAVWIWQPVTSQHCAPATSKQSTPDLVARMNTEKMDGVDTTDAGNVLQKPNRKLKNIYWITKCFSLKRAYLYCLFLSRKQTQNCKNTGYENHSWLWIVSFDSQIRSIGLPVLIMLTLLNKHRNTTSHRFRSSKLKVSHE